jgi:UDP-glucuronate 4-epimerase
MKIFITGVAGFIGFHTARRLLEDGHKVMGIDNLNDYYDVNLKKERLSLLEKLGLEFEQGDICHQGPFLSATLFQPDIFLHLAAQAGVRYASINPKAYVDSNLNGFFNVLEWIRSHPHIPLIYASSSSVYGNQIEAPFKESAKADQPESFYAATKRANELMAYSYHQSFGIKTCGLRFFTVYGPHGRPDMAYYSFTQDFLEGRPLKVYHEGKALRDFTYIDDIVEGIVSVINRAPLQGIYNLGSCDPYSTLELIDCIENYFGKKAIIEFVQGPKGDVDKTYACLTHSFNDLGFKPKTSLKEGMRSFLDWYIQYHKLQVPSS